MRCWIALVVVVAVVLGTVVAVEYPSEIRYLPGHRVFNDYVLPLPSTYINTNNLPSEYTWADVNGVNYLTKTLNQHIPQYCGSCWAHGALSAFADRIKIARKGKGTDISLSIQYVLNCGSQIAGSCYGGSGSGTYEFIKKSGYVPYETCQSYMACSSDSTEGFCASANWECSAINTCRTCSTFTASGGSCSQLDMFPNATVAEYGSLKGADDMKAEIYARGPIACDVNASPLHAYEGGIFSDESQSTRTNHVISIIGWGQEQNGQQYWKVRNSWGEYWGELGYFRIELGKNLLGIEGRCAWATPASWTEVNYPCHEDGANCH